MSVIKAVVFDVGDVLIEVDWKSTFDLLPLNHSMAELRELLVGWETFNAFEEGKISADEFFHALSERIETPLLEHNIHDAWKACLKGPVVGIPHLIQQLATNTRLYTLSNTCQPHYEKWKREDIFGHFDELYTSHKWETRKPTSAIYERLLAETKFLPEQVLFFDDLPENVESARRLGIRAHRVYRNAQEIREILQIYDLLEGD